MKLKLDDKIYSLEAAQKASYRFIDRLTILISTSKGSLLCEINPVKGTESSLEENLENFKRELLDQQLRKQIKEETEPVRNLILAYAFSRSTLQK
jgi:His-Xaa-Ser system protein HxsD